MPYSADISRTNPTCFLFLIDQSSSMAKPFGGSTRQKAEGVADAINRLLQALVFRCTKGMDVLDRYHAAMIRELSSDDGNVLLFNLHLSSRDEPALQFPSGEAKLPDDFARRLFRMSSPLPPAMLEAAKGEHRVAAGAAGFVFNADLVSV